MNEINKQVLNSTIQLSELKFRFELNSIISQLDELKQRLSAISEGEHGKHRQSITAHLGSSVGSIEKCIKHINTVLDII